MAQLKDDNKFGENTGIKDPDGDLKSPASSAHVEHYRKVSNDTDPEGQQGGTEGGRRGSGGGNSGGSILHPQSPREDEQFAAIREKQDKMRQQDPACGDTGEKDPACNAKPRH